MSNATIIATLNPVTKKRVRCEIPGKGRLSDHIVTPDGVIIERNGRPYEDGELFPGDLINIVRPPKGGETGKDVARTGLILATQIGAGLLTSGISSVAWSAAIAGAASVGASIGANALIPPPTQKESGSGEQEQFNRLGSLTGSRNRLNPYGAVPRYYGHRKVFPFHAAKPYTEIVGNQQYLRMRFSLGAGPLEVSDPKIGDTPIGAIDSNNNYSSNGTYDGIKIDIAENPGLYTSSVSESTPDAVFTAWSYDEENEDPPDIVDTHTRTTEADTDEISIDLTFPQGLFGVDDSGRTIGVWMHWKVEYSPTGENDWTDVTEGNVQDAVSFRPRPGGDGWRSVGNKRETWRGALSWEVESGQYDVRITRIDGPFTSVDGAPQLFESATWTALRSITHEDPTDMPGTVQVDMRIKATDQITGVLENFSVEVKSRLAYYDGNEWQEPTFNPSNGTGTGGIVTSNPAWIIADILTGSENARPITKEELDADSFKSFADNCEAENRYCDVALDTPRTVLQNTNLVASTGRGSISAPTGIYEIVQDTDDQTPVQHFTDRNSSDSNSTHTFPNVPHAIRVNYTNPDADWKVDEIIAYDDDYSFDGEKFEGGFGTCALGSEGECKIATKFESIDLSDTITSSTEAWKEARYRMAEARLRPGVHTKIVDFENLICQRGDLVLSTDDVNMWGVASGRIKSISENTLTVDEKILIEEGKDYNIRVRNKHGQSILKSIVTGGGVYHNIEVEDTDDIEAGDLFMFGEVGKETQALKVFSIEPQARLKARMTFIDAAPEIYDADQGDIPDFNSNISSPGFDPETTPPPNPVITSIRSDGDSLYKDTDGNPIMRIMVSYVVGGGAPTDHVQGRFRVEDDEDGWTSFGQSSTGTINLSGAERGKVYIIQIQAVRGNLKSQWVQGALHTAGKNIKLLGRPDNAIGTIVNDLEGTYTHIQVDLLMKVRKGVDFNIMNELERDLFSITPTADAGPGKVTMRIEEQYIEAPSGSYILKSAHQEEGETIDVPGFDFVGDTLAVIGDELASSMDLIAAGIDFGKVAQSQLNEAGEVLMDAFNGTLDDIEDGVNYARVQESSLTDSGLVILSVAIGDLDDVDDGSIYARVDQASLTAEGLVLLSGTIGDIDDIEDGTGFGKVQKASLTAEGLVLLSNTSGDLDDIPDGANYQRVQTASLTASGLVILDMVDGDLDDVDDGESFGRVQQASLTASGLVLVDGLSGDLDDMADGSNFQRVQSASLTSGGLVLLNAVDGDIDDIADGATYGKIDRTSLTAEGLVLLSTTVGSIDDVDDGTTYQKVSSAQLTSSGFVILSQTSGNLDGIDDGTTYQKVSSAQLTASGFVILSQVSGDLDNLSDGDTYARVQKASLTAGGLVLLEETSGDLDDVDDGFFHGKVLSTEISAGHIKIIGPDGQTIIDGGILDTDEIFASEANISNILTMGAGSQITNTGDDYTISSAGFSVARATSYTATRAYNVGSSGRIWENASGLILESSTLDVVLAPDDYIQFVGIPTTNPGGSNRVWSDGGTLKIT